MVLFITLALGYVGYSTISKGVDSSNSTVQIDIPYMKIAHELNILALQHRRYEKDFFLNIGDTKKQESYIEKFKKVSNEVDSKMDLLKNLLLNTNDTSKQIDKLKKCKKCI